MINSVTFLVPDPFLMLFGRHSETRLLLSVPHTALMKEADSSIKAHSRRSACTQHWPSPRCCPASARAWSRRCMLRWTWPARNTRGETSLSSQRWGGLPSDVITDVSFKKRNWFKVKPSLPGSGEMKTSIALLIPVHSTSWQCSSATIKVGSVNTGGRHRDLQAHRFCGDSNTHRHGLTHSSIGFVRSCTDCRTWHTHT